MQQHFWTPVIKRFHAFGAVSHEMALVFHVEALVHLMKHTFELPLLAQQFVNHGSKVYKCYVLGEHTVVSCRPSIRSFNGDDMKQTILFNSKSPLSKDMVEQHVWDQFKDMEEPFVNLSKEETMHFIPISNMLREQLHLDLLGYDVVIEENSNVHFVIDLNYFPHYTGVDTVNSWTLELIQSRFANEMQSNSHSK